MSDPIFISIPRTGTHTVFRALGGGKKNNHLSAKTVRKKVGDEAWRKAYTFSFVRHPFDRAVSWYFFHRTQMIPLYDLTFSQWVYQGCPHHWKDRAKAGVDLVANPLSLCDYLLDDADRVMVKNVFRTETMDRDIAMICKDLGRLPPSPLRLNWAKHPQWEEVWTPLLRHKAPEFLLKDCEVFGYDP